MERIVIIIKVNGVLVLADLVRGSNWSHFGSRPTLSSVSLDNMLKID